MRIRLASRWDWHIPGTRALIAFNAGDYAMTREQGNAAIAAGVGSELPQGTKHDAPKPKRRPRARD